MFLSRTFQSADRFEMGERVHWLGKDPLGAILCENVE